MPFPAADAPISLVTLTAGQPVQFRGTPTDIAVEIGRPDKGLVLMETLHGKTIYINPAQVVSIQDAGTVRGNPGR